MEITIKQTTTKTKKVNIELPYYSKYKDLFYYKVIAENRMIKLVNADGNLTIESTEYCLESPFNSDCKQITESEFNEVKEKIYKAINDERERI